VAKGTLRVLIVDDSVVFRSQIKMALQEVPAIEVVGVANNGKIALEKLAQNSVDLVTLDMEMPEMGGLETLRAIRQKKFPARVIIFSSHTTRGSEAALDALSAGADDFVAKPVAEPGNDFQSAATRIRSDLVPKMLQFFRSRGEETPAAVADGLAPKKTANFSKRDLATFLPSAVVIGSSTGGPPALEKCLTGISSPPRIPIFIAQHMPPVFTASLARRLQEITGIVAAEGKDRELVAPNRIYIAPGDFHMSLRKVENDVRIHLDQGPQRNSVRPAVDNLFESAAKVYGSRCLAVVLTGMGEDGRIGCRAIKEAGGGVMIQDKGSCVVFGMPGAVYADGTFDEIGDLAAVQKVIRKGTA
jgi:two-component system chemotaxis response regulator CheB